MAGAILPMQEEDHRRHGRSWSADESSQGAGWIPVAVGLTALAGVTALAMRNAYGGHIERRYERSPGRKSASPSKPEVERSITIGRSADELRECWQDPETLTQIMAGFATVHGSGGGRMHWKVEGPLGRSYEWDSEAVDGGPGESIGWRSVDGADLPNQGSVRFHSATGNRGTVATLHFRFDPPDGALGAAAKLLRHKPLGLAADGVLRRFKSLVETGEIPTTERQPAARADTR